MTTLRLACPCGHSWEHATGAPIPADVREICPACAGAGDAGDNTRVAPPPVLPEALALTPGRVIGGFEVLEEINRGGMGVIYKARQQGLDRLVALKVIAPKRVGSPESLRRFKMEVRAAALLDHPNIVIVFHTDLDGAVPYLAMEYVPGIDLLRLVRQTGPVDILDACHFIQQAAHGLQHAYEQGLVHRDIKPANLMVTPNPALGRPAKPPKVKLLDMGLALVLDRPEGELDLPETQAGVFLGTPDYVSPEQAEDSRQADVRSDLYSLGATLYYILTGEVPFPGPSVVHKLRRQLTEPPPSPAAKRPAIGADLDALVRKLMSRNPAERVQTPAELVDALDRVGRGLPGGAARAQSTGLLAAAVAGPSSSVTAPLNPVQVLAHPGGVRTLAVGQDCFALVTGGVDGTLKVWNPGRMKETRTIAGDVGVVEQVVLGPAGRWAASCSVRLTTNEMGVQIWSLQTGAEKRRLRGPADNVGCVAVSPDGKSIAAGAADGLLWLWSSDKDGPTTGCMRGHAGPVTGVCFVPSGESLLSTGVDGTIRQWDPTTGKSRGVLQSPVGAVASLAYGGKRVAVAGARGLAVRQRDGAVLDLDGHDGAVLCAGVSQDGKFVASGGTDGKVKVWDTSEGKLLTTFAGHAGPVRAVAFGPDGGVVYSGGEDGTLRRWPVAVSVA